jgi:nucleoside-diphosphate-sugar epimerase
MSRDLVLVFGGTGAIGKPLLAALTQKHGPHTCVVAMRRTPLAADLPVIGEMNVDLRDAQSVERIVCKYAARIRAIWNLAAPLSVDTAANPEVAEDVTVNGMSRLIAAMNAAQLPDSTLLLFSDSIGSFGADAPRENVDAAWLVSHPDQGGFQSFHHSV